MWGVSPTTFSASTRRHVTGHGLARRWSSTPVLLAVFSQPRFEFITKSRGSLQFSSMVDDLALNNGIQFFVGDGHYLLECISQFFHQSFSFGTHYQDLKLKGAGTIPLGGNGARLPVEVS